MSGTIPPELGSLSNLGWLYLHDNQLSGTIPPELGSLSNLYELSLSNNQLSGMVPAEIGGLFSLQGLYLHDNQLAGTVPPELGSLSNLQWLYLSNNQLTGCVPAELRDVRNSDLDQLRLPFCAEGSSPLDSYDENGNGVVDRDELIRAINDYLLSRGLLTRNQALDIIYLYLFG